MSEDTLCNVQFVYMLTMATKQYLSIDIMFNQRAFFIHGHSTGQLTDLHIRDRPKFVFVFGAENDYF